MTYLRRYEPWSLLSQLHNEMDRMFDRPTAGNNALEANAAANDWSPAVDVKEDNEKYVIMADVPGVDPKDIDVSMENGVLTIRGERHSEHSEEKENLKRVERSYGSFYRRFTLPDNVDVDNIHASGKNGVLSIMLPKSAPAKAKKIEIQS
jgi:HSP20 family protein